MRNKYDIFLSYRRSEGKDIARMMKESLERKGYRVFLDMDELQDGVFDKRILDAIKQAPVYMILMTTHCFDRCQNESDWVRQEIEYALISKKTIIPINPDKQFAGFDKNCPEHIRQGLSQHQYSAIDTGQLYQVSIEQLDKDRLQSILHQSKRQWWKYTLILLLLLGGCAALTQHYVKSYRPNHYLALGDSALCGSDADTALAISYYQKAISYGAITGYARIGDVYDSKMGMWITNQDSAFQYYRKGAWAGDVYSQSQIASLYASVFNSEQNRDSAFYWCQKVYDSGYYKGAGLLGHAYEAGIGVPVDITKAANLFREGCEAQDPYAQVRFGLYQRMGTGMEKNFVEGSRNIVNAAVQGDIMAKYHLGKLHTWCFYPAYDSVTEPLLSIKAISWSTDDTMRLYCEWHNLHYGWMQIDRKAYVRNSQTLQHYPISDVYNCAFSPDTTPVAYGHRHYFVLSFPHVPDTVSKIDFLESDTSDWKVFGIKIENIHIESYW